MNKLINSIYRMATYISLYMQEVQYVYEYVYDFYEIIYYSWNNFSDIIITKDNYLLINAYKDINSDCDFLLIFK